MRVLLSALPSFPWPAPARHAGRRTGLPDPGLPVVLWLLFPDSWFSLWLGATVALGGMREPAAGSSGVFVLEPEAIAQVALGPFSRLGLGAYYR